MSEEKLKYSMLIEWDKEGQSYTVTLPEWISETNGQHIVHGDTYEKAAKAGKEILESLVEVARNEGDRIPEPTVASDEEEERWPASWLIQSLQAEMRLLYERLDLLGMRFDNLGEEEISLKAFCRGVTLLGYRLIIEPATKEGENK
jgi:antitoxin HicB